MTPKPEKLPAGGVSPAVPGSPADDLDYIKRRLRSARARVRYHSRSSMGASNTHKPQGEALSLARADVEQLQYFRSKLANE